MTLNLRKMKNGSYQAETPAGEKIDNLKVDRVHAGKWRNSIEVLYNISL